MAVVRHMMLTVFRRGLLPSLPFLLVCLFIMMIYTDNHVTDNDVRYDGEPDTALFLADSRLSPPLPGPETRGRSQVLQDMPVNNRGRPQNDVIKDGNIHNSSVVTEHALKDPHEDTDDVTCDQECLNFRKMMQQWPTGKPRGAIYYLVHHSRLHFLKKSLESLESHFLSKFSYPLILFHEEELRPYKDKVSAMLNSTHIYFQEITFRTPGFIKTPLSEMIPCMSSIGYRHMCRFQAKLVYQQPILEDLDYYWRLDDDSFLMGPVPYDLFSYMRDHQVDYGYSWIHLDSHTCTRGLWEATDSYVAQHNIHYHFYDEWPSPKIYYNNFEISALRVWRSAEYQQFIDYIDRQGGIYYHRWGDAPIKGIAVSLFIPKSRTHHFGDVPYAHGSYNSLDFIS